MEYRIIETFSISISVVLNYIYGIFSPSPYAHKYDSKKQKIHANILASDLLWPTSNDSHIVLDDIARCAKPLCLDKNNTIIPESINPVMCQYMLWIYWIGFIFWKRNPRSSEIFRQCWYYSRTYILYTNAYTIFHIFILAEALVCGSRECDKGLKGWYI